MALLIKNVRVLGSAENFSDAKDAQDVLINGDKIAAIGDFPNKAADEVFDGGGAYLSPGFIDTNTDSDHFLSILDYPEQEDFVSQGVTTIIGGMCGSSLAPLLYGSLESVQKWGDIRKVNVNWHTVKEFLDILAEKKLAVNFATLVGHATIRRGLVRDSLRPLTRNELKILGETVKRALSEGAFGFSTGLGYAHGLRTPYAEIKLLAEIAKSFNAVYATHLRDSGKNLPASIAETVRVAKETEVKTLISHFVPREDAKNYYEKALRELASLPQKINLRFDVYPYDESLLALYTFLPPWAQNGGKEKMLANLKDEWLRPKIKGDLEEVDADNFVVARGGGKGALVGRSLEDLEEMYGAAEQSEALLRLMLSTNLNAVILYKNLDEKLLRRAMRNSRSFISSNAPSLSEKEAVCVLKPERAKSTFTRFLGMVVFEKLLPLGEAVRKITAEAAAEFDLRGRGTVREGDFADLAVWSIGAGAPKAEVKLTVVNGEAVWKNGAPTENFSGRPLKHART